jgi:hypothetical protein
MQVVVDCISPGLHQCPDELQQQFSAGLEVNGFLCGDESKSPKYPYLVISISSFWEGGVL